VLLSYPRHVRGFRLCLRVPAHAPPHERPGRAVRATPYASLRGDESDLASATDWRRRERKGRGGVSGTDGRRDHVTVDGIRSQCSGRGVPGWGWEWWGRGGGKQPLQPESRLALS